MYQSRTLFFPDHPPGARSFILKKKKPSSSSVSSPKILFIHPPECWISLFHVLLNHLPISILFMLDQNFSSLPLTTLLPIIIIPITLKISLHSEHNSPSHPYTCWIFPFHLSMSVSLSFILHIYRGLNAITSQPSNLPSKISSNPFHHLPNHIFQNALKFSPRCGLKFPKKKVLTFLLRGFLQDSFQVSLFSRDLLSLMAPSPMQN